MLSEIERLGLERMLLLTTERGRALGDDLARSLGARVVGTFTGVREHVPVEVAREARALARSLSADGLLAVGGGSTIGTAKAVALETPLPIVAVPTTYAGSEMTPIWGLTESGHKRTGRSPDVLPRLVLYDPDLTLGLPARVTGPSALNALAHCVEALYAAGTNPITTLVAEEGMRALARGLPAAVASPMDPTGRADTLYGAYLAGAALGAAGTGLHHKICHVLGGAFNLPHAETHAAVLPQVVWFQQSAIPSLMKRVAVALGAETAAGGLYDLAERVGAPVALKTLGLRAEQLDEAVPLVLAVAPPENPRPVDRAAVRRILQHAFDGRRPYSDAGAA